MSEHLSYLALLDLVQGRTGEDAVGRAFGHLAFCDECSTRLLAVRDLRSDFDTAWRDLESFGSVRLENIEPRVSISLRVTLDRARMLARIVLDRLLPDEVSGFDVRPIPVPTGAAADTPDPRAAQAELRLSSAQLGEATVIADSQHQAISVLLRPPEGLSLERLLLERTPRLILRSRDHDERREAFFVSVEGANYLLAEFRPIEGVEWIVGIESGPAEE